MKKHAVVDLLEAGAADDRAKRVAAAKTPPAAWCGIDSVLKNGALVDVKFDVESAEPAMAEFYAPGCTRGSAEPIIENVAFVNGDLRPVVDAEGARLAASLAGQWGDAPGMGYGIMSVTLTHWRPAAYPFIG